MADFCRQCSLELRGEDFFELEGLCQEGTTVDALCEGCGPTKVNFRGECTFHEENGGTAEKCFQAYLDANDTL